MFLIILIFITLIFCFNDIDNYDEKFTQIDDFFKPSLNKYFDSFSICDKDCCSLNSYDGLWNNNNNLTHDILKSNNMVPTNYTCYGNSGYDINKYTNQINNSYQKSGCLCLNKKFIDWTRNKTF